MGTMMLRRARRQREARGGPGNDGPGDRPAIPDWHHLVKMDDGEVRMLAERYGIDPDAQGRMKTRGLLNGIRKRGYVA